MALQDAWGYDGKTYSGQEMRLQVAALTQGKGGVAQVADYKATPQGVANNTVSIAAGTMVIPATHAGDLGSYEVPNDAALASPAFGAAGANPRWDLLLLQVIAGVPTLVVVAGTPAGSPSYPSLAAYDNYQVICGVKMPAGKSIIDNGANGTIDDRRSVWTPRVTCTSATRPPIPFDGQHIYETDTGKEYTYHSAISTWIFTGPQPFVCTSGTRPVGFNVYEGLEIYETDTDKKWLYDGAQWVQIFQRDWTVYAPNVRNAGNANVTRTVTSAKYTRSGKTIRAVCRLDITSNSAGVGQIAIDLPVDAAIPAGATVIGTASFYDTSGTLWYFGQAILDVSTTPDSVYLVRDQAALGGATQVQLGIGDGVWYEVEYEAAAF